MYILWYIQRGVKNNPKSSVCILICMSCGSYYWKACKNVTCFHCLGRKVSRRDRAGQMEKINRNIAANIKKRLVLSGIDHLFMRGTIFSPSLAFLFTIFAWIEWYRFYLRPLKPRHSLKWPIWEPFYINLIQCCRIFFSYVPFRLLN